jgi:hypothetical protein
MMMGSGLVLSVIEVFPHLNMQTKLSQPTAAKLIYKSPTGFVMSFMLALVGMIFALIAVQAALASLQSLIQPSLTSGMSGSKNPIINFMIFLISGAFGLIMSTAMCYSILELDLNKQ